MLVVPLTAVGWFSIREVERNDAATERSMLIASAVAESSAAAATLIPLEAEQLASLGLVGSAEGSTDADVFRELVDDARPRVDRALDDLDRTLRREPSSNVASIEAIRQASMLLDAARERVDEGEAMANGVESEFEVVADRATDALGGAGTVVPMIGDGSTDAADLVTNLALTTALVETAQSELHSDGMVLLGLDEITEIEKMAGPVRHEDALEDALVVDPTAIRQLSSSHDDLRASSDTSSTNALLRRIDYALDVEAFAAAERAVAVSSIDAWALDARSRNENTLLLLIGIGIGTLLFGFVVLRSFASPLIRLRLQAERISRGELNAEPIPVAGPSDVRKVTGAINDMASTLSLVEDHMDALALAELNELPELDALPGHVGSTMRASMERVVALTSRLQTSESRLAEEARIDNLTGLPNRFAVLEYLERLLTGLTATSNQPGRVPAVGVMFLDVDGFKSVNDTHGHAVGDVVLRDIAQRLRGSIRDVDFVARLGGDEFLVVVADMNDPTRLVGFGERMIGEIEQPYTIGDQLFAVSASVGATMVEPGDEPLSVIERADAAVYQAKRRGRRRVEMFDKELQRSIEHQAELELALRQAIQHGELRMYLQPLADLNTGLPAGAEALVRWERPGVGLVSPNDFIPIAERSGLIFDLERWMLETACRRIAEWRLMGKGEGMRLAVNISGRHLIEGNLIADLDDAIAATGADPNLLEIELTESHLLDDVARASAVLAGVRNRGVKVAIDDFGTGYSSMTYLQKLPVDIVKIDRSFISSATTNDFDSTIVDTVVTLGRTLDLDVVAEGIETVEQLAYVINAGVSLGQGFLLARPVPAHEAEAVIFNGPLFDRDKILAQARERGQWSNQLPIGASVSRL
jgi:diguanylate cyclase (GGDEF)-like protein